jgi:hypothetical protein
VSVVIGVLLGQSADKADSRPKYNFSKFEYQKGNKNVKSIEGYFFAKGSSAEDYYMQGIEDFSLGIRRADGTLQYSSGVADEFGINGYDDFASLSGVVRDIHDAGGRACGYFYVRAFDERDEGLRSVYAAYELALINEAARSGIDEILLVGINVAEGNIDAVEEFLARASAAAENVAIGVAVSLDTLRLAEQEVYYLQRLDNSCDFLAIDLTHLTVKDVESQKDAQGKIVPGALETILEQNEYYVKNFKLRLLFSRQEYLIYRTALELGVVDFQIIEN